VRDLLQLIVAGLSQGAVYGLVAVGFVTVYSVSGVINLLQGQFSAIAAFIAITLRAMGFNLAVACLVGIALVIVLSVVVERTAVRRLYHAPSERIIIATLGLLITAEGVTLLLWGPASRGLPPFTAGYVNWSGVVISKQSLWILGVTVVIGGALWWYFMGTQVGKAFRASSEQPVASRLVGISPARMYRTGFVLAGALGGVAGIVVSSVQLTSWDTGLTLGLEGFVAAGLAGFVSVPGALAGGVFLGIVEAMTARYISSGWASAIAFVLLIVMLIVRPQGLTKMSTVRV